MQLTFNKHTALALLRLARHERGRRGLVRRPSQLIDPSPEPNRRWTSKLLAQALQQAGLSSAPASPVYVCTSKAGKRPKHRSFACTVYAGGLPSGAFLQIAPGLAMSSPELLFVELANELSPAEHLLLGFELTGSYALDPHAAKGGKAKLGIPATTSVERIGGFLDTCWHLNGTHAARRTLALLADGAWSPFESIVATVMSLPWEEYGYGFGRCVLNRRIQTPEHLEGSAQKESRVPDILIEGTHVGMNYDGGDHLPLDAIANAGIALGRDPGNGHIADELDTALSRARAKYVDDGRPSCNRSCRAAISCSRATSRRRSCG